ncbi:MAG TPA: DNA-deoxyinosine glycosylase [Candidatus Anaerotignum merdipullorum]|nr:DNA-deoxyinosine glycosylase [Candidatus Anaerotignum merdipullorum]
MEAVRVRHTFAPIYQENSKVLILGTVPSVKSRETDFYYGHPRNRFWQVISSLCRTEIPQTKEEKIQMLLENCIALYDVVESCTIIGSSDSSIRDVIPVNLEPILEQTGDIPIFTNGSAAWRLYRKFLEVQTGITAYPLPSTSPANAAWSLQRLTEVWKEALTPYL